MDLLPTRQNKPQKLKLYKHYIKGQIKCYECNQKWRLTYSMVCKILSLVKSPKSMAEEREKGKNSTREQHKKKVQLRKNVLYSQTNLLNVNTRKKTRARVMPLSNLGPVQGMHGMISMTIKHNQAQYVTLSIFYLAPSTYSFHQREVYM